MQQDKASEDLQVAQQIQAGIREAATLPPQQRQEKIKRMTSLMGGISDPAIKKDLKEALGSATPLAKMDTLISGLVKRRSVAGSKLRARGLLLSANQGGGFSESSVINAATALHQAGVPAEGPGSLRHARNKYGNLSDRHAMLDKLDVTEDERADFLKMLNDL